VRLVIFRFIAYAAPRGSHRRVRRYLGNRPSCGEPIRKRGVRGVLLAVCVGVGLPEGLYTSGLVPSLHYPYAKLQFGRRLRAIIRCFPRCLSRPRADLRCISPLKASTYQPGTALTGLTEDQVVLCAYRNGKLPYFEHSGTGFSEKAMKETIDRLPSNFYELASDPLYPSME
jgi:hypothetical protein